MKQMRLTFEDKDFKHLLSEKRDLEEEVEHSVSWENFILRSVLK